VVDASFAATMISGVVAGGVCSQEATKLISTADMGAKRRPLCWAQRSAFQSSHPESGLAALLFKLLAPPECPNQGFQ